MPKLLCVFLLSACLTCAASLQAQQVCPGLPYVADTPEDELMQAVNGAENPQEQIAALDKFAQAHSDSKFMPCVHEYYTIAYLKLNQYDQVIEQGEKGLSGSYQDTMLIMNVTKAYLASGKVNDAAFATIMKAPEQIKSETSPPKPPNVSDAEWQKNLQDLADQAKEERSYMEYAFLQLLPRVTDGNKRVEFLDAFMKSYPDTTNVGQLNFQYFMAYLMTNNPAKADEYGEKAIAADPNNVECLNAVANDYATRQVNLDKATAYAKKVLELAPALKKPEGITDDQFKTVQDNQIGLAHATLGYVEYLKGAKTHKVGPAIQEYKTAVDLLRGNPTLQGRTLYYLGYAYEVIYPPNHKLADEALTRAISIPSPWQGQAQELLAKVKQAEKQ
jgi:tetratricopeptide (TPR) repeat protein